VTTDPDLLPVDEVVRRSDVLILAVPHAAYRDLDLGGKPIVDLWDFLGPRPSKN
jgi:UDP-N-acetyl-D-mannosaminuronic acid dehydrogenase